MTTINESHVEQAAQEIAFFPTAVLLCESR